MKKLNSLYKDDGSKVTELKQWISQKMIWLPSTVTFLPSDQILARYLNPRLRYFWFIIMWTKHKTVQDKAMRW